MPEFRLIALSQLLEPELPVRFTMDDEKMQELCDSIRNVGLLQNLVVVPSVQSRAVPQERQETDKGASLSGNAPLYEIVAGHRRFKAAQFLNLPEVPCLIFQDKELARHAAMLDENLCREDITAAEEATLYAELIDKYDYTEEQLLSVVKRPASYVYTRLALLKGNPAVLDAVRERKLTLSVATQLNRVDNADHCAYLTRMAIEGGATARVVMEWVQEYKKNGPSPTVSLEPFKQAGAEGYQTGHAVKCFLCQSSQYPGNIVWVPIHDFERDKILEQVGRAAELPPQEEVPPV